MTTLIVIAALVVALILLTRAFFLLGKVGDELILANIKLSLRIDPSMWINWTLTGKGARVEMPIGHGTLCITTLDRFENMIFLLVDYRPISSDKPLVSRRIRFYENEFGHWLIYVFGREFTALYQRQFPVTDQDSRQSG